jgi:hypothetical protein
MNAFNLIDIGQLVSLSQIVLGLTYVSIVTLGIALFFDFKT